MLKQLLKAANKPRGCLKHTHPCFNIKYSPEQGSSTPGLQPVQNRAGEMGKCTHIKLCLRERRLAHKLSLLVRAELGAQVQVASTHAPISIGVSGGHEDPPLTQMDLCMRVRAPGAYAPSPPSARLEGRQAGKVGDRCSRKY